MLRRGLSGGRELVPDLYFLPVNLSLTGYLLFSFMSLLVYGITCSVHRMITD